MKDLFDNYQGAKVYYHPISDRLFIFHKATFLMLPCIEREDGVKMICSDPYDVNWTGNKEFDERFKLELIGDL